MEIGNSSGQYMDKPLPRDYGAEEEKVNRPSFEGLKEKLSQFPRPKITRKQLKMFGGIVGLLVVLAIAVKLMTIFTGPKFAAEAFFKAEILNGDYDKVYAMLDLPSGKFLTEEQFTDVNFEPLPTEVTNYEVSEKNKKQEVSYNSYFDDWEDEFYSETPDFVSNCTVQYTVKGESSLFQKDYQLIRMGKIIPQWKVSAGDFLARQVQIYAPESVHLTLDGIELNEEDIAAAENNNSYSGYYEGYRCYTVDLFAGNHEIYAEADYMDPQTIEVYFEGYETYEVPQLSLSANTIDSMQQTMVELLQKIYDTAYEDGDPLPLYSYVTADEGENFADIYYNIRNSMHEREITLGNLEFANFSSELQNTYQSNGKYYAEMLLTYDYAYDYQYVYHGWFGDEEIRTEEENSDSTMYVTFLLDEDSLKIDNISLYTIY